MNRGMKGKKKESKNVAGKPLRVRLVRVTGEGTRNQGRTGAQGWHESTNFREGGGGDEKKGALMEGTARGRVPGRGDASTGVRKLFDQKTENLGEKTPAGTKKCRRRKRKQGSR